ncbi:MAG: hypothetical protein OXH00_03000 [Candidatus Poribacteria bacterium]|nr:hypothetical protein [Candidatus Poribacteria bacterium]
MTYKRMLFGVILACCCVATAMTGYGYEVLPNVRFLSGGTALLLGGSSLGCIVLFIVAYHVDKTDKRR